MISKDDSIKGPTTHLGDDLGDPVSLSDAESGNSPASLKSSCAFASGADTNRIEWAREANGLVSRTGRGATSTGLSFELKFILRG